MSVLRQRSAKGSRITIGGTTLFTQKGYNTTIKGDKLETGNFESVGVNTGTIGFTGFEYSFEGDWDAHANMLDAPGIYPRDDLATVKLYENVSDNVFHAIALSLVLSCTNNAPVRQLVTFGAQCEANGAYSLATGSI